MVKYRILLSFFCCFILQNFFAETFVLENDFLQLHCDTAGGRISSLFLKDAAVELTDSAGLLGDDFWNIAESRLFYNDFEYDAQTDENTIKMRIHQRGGGVDFLELNKDIILEEAMINVNYRLKNLPAAMATVEYALRSRNFMGKTDGKKKNWFFPLINGIKTENAQGVQYSYYRQPSRGWMAFADEDGNGLAITVDYRILDRFYAWFGAPAITQEFFLDPQSIAADAEWKTTMTVLPFKGLDKVSGVGGALVGSVSVNPDKGPLQHRDIKAVIYSAKKQKVKFELYLRRLRSNSEKKLLDTYSFEFQNAGQVLNLDFKHVFANSPGLFEFELLAYDENGKQLTSFCTPAGMHTDTLTYRMNPEFKRTDRKNAEIDLTKFNFSTEGEHIPWARPLAGGKIKLLAITPISALPELGKLAQRIDIDLHTLLWTAPYMPQWASGKYYGLITLEDISNNLDKLLSEDYDVILIAGIKCNELSKAQQEAILQKINNGCGIIDIGNSGEDFLQKIAAIQKDKGSGTGSSANAVKNNASSFNYFPFELLPKATYHTGTLQGKLLVEINQQPFLAYKEIGKGRSLSLAWASNGGSGKMVGGLTPELNWPLENAEYKNYPELYMLLLSKMIVTASRGIEYNLLENLEIQQKQADKFSLEITLAEKFKTHIKKIEIFIRNSDDEKLFAETFPVTSNSSKINLELPLKCWNGKQLLGIILKNANDEVLDFAVQTIEYKNSPGISLLNSDKQFYNEGETAVFSISTTIPAIKRWNLADSYGRILAKGESSEEQISVKIQNTLPSRKYRFTAELLQNEEIVDKAVCNICVKPDLVWNQWKDFEAGIWLTPRTSDAIRQYLWPEFAAALRKMNIKNILANSRTLDIDFAVEHNFNPTVHQNAGTSAASLPKKYLESKSKLDLVRSPCLNDPNFRKQQKEKFQKLAELYADRMPRFYWFGDELSLTGYWSSPVDYCFSEFCLAKFQLFLKEKYNNLETLNQQWANNYNSFAEAIPETAAETRNRKDKNHSAWADHLEFMDTVLSEYISDFTENALRKSDPLARGAISGPQAASAYGGNDWQKQSQVYATLMSYPYGALNEILHSFNPHIIDLPWVLGYGNNDEKVAYDLWKSIANGASGAMAFHGVSMVEPDFNLSPTGEAAARYLPQLCNGVGALFINALNKADPEACIVYSQASIRAAYINGRAIEHENFRWKYVNLCRNFGIPFRFINENDLINCKEKLLILPDINALSDQSLEDLQKIKNNGTIILSDGDFAAYDQSCRFRKRQLPETLHTKGNFSLYKEFWLKEVSERSEVEQEALQKSRAFFASALEKAGIKPKALSKNLELEYFFFTDNAGRLFKLVLNPHKENYNLNLPNVWDIRNSKSVESYEITQDNALFYIEQKPDTILSFEKSAGKQNFELAIKNSDRNDTVFNLTVIAPNSQIVTHYNGNFFAPGGKLKKKFAFALNDQKGEWKFQIRDIISGKSAILNIQHQ